MMAGRREDPQRSTTIWVAEVWIQNIVLPWRLPFHTIHKTNAPVRTSFGSTAHAQSDVVDTYNDVPSRPVGSSTRERPHLTVTTSILASTATPRASDVRASTESPDLLMAPIARLGVSLEDLVIDRCPRAIHRPDTGVVVENLGE